MNNNRYSLSFTSATLLYRESITVAELFFELKDWSKVRTAVIADNLLQVRTQNTSQRFCSEITSRLKKLTLQELELLVQGNSQEQVHLLWVALCRRYTLIGDFAVEIIRERFISLTVDLNTEDFEAFIHKKSERHDELVTINPTTRNKLRQVLFKMLREADLISADNTAMTTNLAIDDDLINVALNMGHFKSKEDAVVTALREFINRRKQLEIVALFGQFEPDQDYDYKQGRLTWNY